ncbi:hypothetical protein LJC71_01915 [Desulfosarcina sp. OttesenSCG-928-A07]|nr:hypothetical protein [Desulfosarcina sp. OttesenSCG-928-G17]MDL2328494.1 hypothetical protein [Desulfosarcina sp. OttesenSCG-928-A07]
MIAASSHTLWKIAAVFLCVAAVFLTGTINQQTRDALKVQTVLKTIEGQSTRIGKAEQTTHITQSELNAYIAWRISREEKTVIRHAAVELLDDNNVEGVILLDTTALNLNLFFGEQLELAFSAILHSENQTARLNLTTLAVNGQSISPEVTKQVLRQVTHAASWYYGEPVTGLEDEYELPPGVKRLGVKKAGVILYH